MSLASFAFIGPISGQSLSFRASVSVHCLRTSLVGPSLGRLRTVSGPSLGRPWAVSGPSLGRLWAVFGPSPDRLWTVPVVPCPADTSLPRLTALAGGTSCPPASRNTPAIPERPAPPRTPVFDTPVLCSNDHLGPPTGCHQSSCRPCRTRCHQKCRSVAPPRRATRTRGGGVRAGARPDLQVE